jgi:hypothetical protein
MTAIHVITASKRLADAQALVFEYLAATQAEGGRTVPPASTNSPAFSRDECTDLANACRPPGTLLLAYQHHEPIGCVGLRPIP